MTQHPYIKNVTFHPASIIVVPSTPSERQAAKTLTTPNWRQLSEEAYRARVVELLMFVTTRTVSVKNELIDSLCAAGREYEHGPYDVACEIIDQSEG